MLGFNSGAGGGGPTPKFVEVAGGDYFSPGAIEPNQRMVAQARVEQGIGAGESVCKESMAGVQDHVALGIERVRRDQDGDVVGSACGVALEADLVLGPLQG